MSIARPDDRMPALRPPARASNPRHARLGALLWLPALVLTAGLAAGIVLWARWGLAVAFDALRAYCL